MWLLLKPGITTRNDNQEYTGSHSWTTDVNNKGTNGTHVF